MQHRQLPLCLLLAACTLAQADEKNSLDEIVVSATRMETTLRDAARSVSLIDKERIQNATQQLGLDEALAAVPGLYMQNRYNFTQDLRVSLRGFGARSGFGVRGVKIVVDGIPETLPDGQAQVDSIDLGSAERIVVLRGPASSQYGNASGGVIAITSESGTTEPYLEAGIAAGELGYSKYQLKTGGSHDALDYMLNVSRREIEGWREQSLARGSIVNGRLGWQINDSDRLTLVLNNTDQPVEQDAGGINAAQAEADPRSARDLNLTFDAGESLSQQRLGVVYDRARDAGTLSLRNYYVWRDFGNTLPFVAGGAVDLDRFYYGAGLQYTFGDLLPERLELSAGVDYDRQDDDRRRFDNNNGTLGAMVFDQRELVDSAAVYLLGQYHLDDAWAISAGVRYDNIGFTVTDRYLADGDDSGSIEFNHVSPSVGINYKFGDSTLFASYSSGFETPTTTELANPDASGGFNPSLDSQEADNIELGYKTATEHVFFEVAVFRIDLENELVPFELEAFPDRTFYRNAGRSDRQGIETALSYQADNGFGVEASYTWSDFTFDTFTDEGGTDYAGKRLPGLPEHFAYLGLSWQGDSGLRAVFETQYSGKLYADNANDAPVESYTVSNLRISRAYHGGRWRVKPYVGLNNLFDERYNTNIRINAFGARYYEPAPPRNVYAGVVVDFGAGR